MAIKWTLNRILLGSFTQEKVAADATMAASGSAAVQTQTSVSTAAAAETASAWGPAAGTAAVGSFGTAAVLAAAGIASVLAMIMAFKGFQQGGYTGAGRPDEVRGLVHAGEFVIPAPVVNQVGVPALEAFTRRGEIDARSFAAIPAQWADRPAQPSQLKVSIENTGTPKDFTVQYVTADEVRFIASDIVHKETEPLMTSRLSNPNSKFSKALGNQTDTKRRR